ncbi:homeodomain transcription factor ste12 [Podochytrium sp. JEL0797]|nr:homeodomain transcription factor ste12 [Podochytrium sp. JEL0797]
MSNKRSHRQKSAESAPVPHDNNQQPLLDPDHHAASLDALKLFLVTAPSAWPQGQAIKRLRLPTGESIACVLWNNLYHITGTDIVKALHFRFAAFGRPVQIFKKFEEGVFSDLRNLKPGVDASLEEPRSPLLEFLFKANCIRTQKKQKVFYWFSVPHDRLFLDALERDIKREAQGLEPTTTPSGMAPDVAMNLAKQQCLPTFALPTDANNPSNTPGVFSRQPSAQDNFGGSSSTPNMQLHQQQQFTNAEYEQELFNQALSAVTSQVNSPYLDANNNFQLPVSFQQQPFLPSPLLQNTRLSPLSMTHHFIPPAQFLPPQQQQLSSPNSPEKRARLEVPRPSSLSSNSTNTSPTHKTLKLPTSSPSSLLETSPTFKQRPLPATTTRPSASSTSPTNPHHPMHPDQFRNATDLRHFTCHKCTQTFKRFEHLKRHYRLHTGEKPFACTVHGCSKRFARADGFGAHLKTHGLSSGEVAAAVRKVQEEVGDDGDEGEGSGGEGGVGEPELSGESPLALVTPLSMMANHQANGSLPLAGNMFSQSVLLQGMQVGAGMYPQEMEQLHANQDMLLQQQQNQQQQQFQQNQGQSMEEFSTFFNMGEESPTSLSLPDASAFLSSEQQQQQNLNQQLYKPLQQQYFNFQVPSHGNLHF